MEVNKVTESQKNITSIKTNLSLKELTTTRIVLYVNVVAYLFSEMTGYVILRSKTRSVFLWNMQQNMLCFACVKCIDFEMILSRAENYAGQNES